MEYIKSLANTDHPLKGYLSVLISAWDHGQDIICGGAHFDVAAPALGLATCWAWFRSYGSKCLSSTSKGAGHSVGKEECLCNDVLASTLQDLWDSKEKSAAIDVV